MVWRSVGARSVLAAAVLLFQPVLPALSAQDSTAQPAALPLSAYGELPGIEDLAVSPSGQRVAMLARIDGKRFVVVRDGEGKTLLALEVGNVKVRGIELISDEILMMQRSTTERMGFGFVQDKVEFYQAILVSIPTRQLSVVFAGNGKLVPSVFGYYGTRVVDGRPTGYFGAIELVKSNVRSEGYVFDHGRPALYAVDLLDGSHKRVGASAREGEDREWLIGPDGTIAARLDESGTTGEWQITGRSGVIASGRRKVGGVYLITLGKDGTTAIFGQPKDDDGTTGWFEVPLDGSSAPVEVYADEEIERIFTDRRTGVLTGFLRKGDTNEPVFFDPDRTAKVKKVQAAFATLNHRMIDWTPDFAHVIVRTDGNGDSGSVYKVDLARSRADPIGWERPLIGPEHVAPVSTVSYTAADGMEMDGILTLPPGRKPENLPLVMLPHGGPHSHDSEEFDWWAQALASRGYAVFQPNFRGSTNRDEAFIQAGYGEWGGKMQSDLSDGLAALAAKGIVDPKRACIVGASYGGYAALAGVTLQQGIYRCAVSVAGVSDVSLLSRIEYRESGENKVRARSLERQLGPRDRYRQISPRNFAAQADAPILLIHGRDDTVVPYDQSVRMANALKEAGKPHEFIELPGEDHWLSLGETRMAMLDATVRFVMQHNPPQ